ncbi:MAG TPA: hypothetical protein VGF14_07160 [Alphaproteobacteria bacterium]
MDMKHVQVKLKDDELYYTYQVLMSEGAAFAFQNIIKNIKKLDHIVWNDFLQSRDDLMLHDYTDKNNLKHAAIVAQEVIYPESINYHFKQYGKEQDPHDSKGNNIYMKGFNVPLAGFTAVNGSGWADFYYRTNNESKSPRNLKGEVLIDPVNGKPYPQMMNFTDYKLNQFENEKGEIIKDSPEIKEYNHMLKAYQKMQKSGVDIFAEIANKPFVVVHSKPDENKPA